MIESVYPSKHLLLTLNISSTVSFSSISDACMSIRNRRTEIWSITINSIVQCGRRANKEVIFGEVKDRVNDSKQKQVKLTIVFENIHSTIAIRSNASNHLIAFCIWIVGVDCWVTRLEYFSTKNCFWFSDRRILSDIYLINILTRLKHGQS